MLHDPSRRKAQARVQAVQAWRARNRDKKNPRAIGKFEYGGEFLSLIDQLYEKGILSEEEHESVDRACSAMVRKLESRDLAFAKYDPVSRKYVLI